MRENYEWQLRNVHTDEVLARMPLDEVAVADENVAEIVMRLWNETE